MTKETMKANFEITLVICQVFKKLKEVFMSSLVLTYFDPNKLILLVTDTLGFAYAVILLQPFSNNLLP